MSKVFTLTRISAVTGLLVLLVQGSVLFFGWPETQDQQAWLSGFIVALGAAVHTIFNPNITFGGK